VIGSEAAALVAPGFVSGFARSFFRIGLNGDSTNEDRWRGATTTLVSTFLEGRDRVGPVARRHKTR
jgi:hypothetical protein